MVTASDAASALLDFVPLPAAGSARLWWVSLDVPDAAGAALLDLLTDGERQRAESYPHVVRGRRFARGRAALRLLLGAWISCDPRELVLGANGDGKPVLAGELPAGGALHFNLSHAGDLAVIAIDDRSPVGVDLVAVQARLPIDTVAPRFFSATERAVLASAPDEATRRERFARLWVRKEAWLKALGTGISERMRATDLSAGLSSPGAPGAATEGMKPVQVDGWEVRDLEGLPPGHVASVASRPGAGTTR